MSFKRFDKNLICKFTRFYSHYTGPVARMRQDCSPFAFLSMLQDASF